MRVCFDTSVVVPALVAAHPHHARALVWVDAASRGDFEAVMAWHGVAETWSVLTRLPLTPPVGARAAKQMVDRLVTVCKPLAMSAPVYQEAILRSTERGVRSGALFDALHLVAAERGQADVFLTFNPADFERLASAGGPRIVVPPDPPRAKV